MRSEPIRLTGRSADRPVNALVSPVGASLQGLEVGDLPVVCGDPSGPVAASGAVLVPWPNRIRGGRWSLDGSTQQLEQTEQPAGNALHGLVAGTTFAVVARESDSVTLAATVDHPPGYPFRLDVVVSYRLTPSGVRSSIMVVNRTGRTAPVAVGVHPYFRVGDAGRDELFVQIDAARTLLLGSDNLPLTETTVAGTLFDVRDPAPLSRVPGHAAYTSLAAASGRVRMRLADRRRGVAVEVRADERFRWAQLYVTAEVPGLGPGGVAVALEPMTAPPDAFNSGRDLRWMEPWSTWTLTWSAKLVVG